MCCPFFNNKVFIDAVFDPSMLTLPSASDSLNIKKKGDERTSQLSGQVFAGLTSKENRFLPVKEKSIQSVPDKRELRNGTIEEGTIIDGLLHGEGKRYIPHKGLTLEGMFDRGRLVRGKIVNFDGTTSIGEFNPDGLLEGEGSIVYPNGGGYEGYFKAGIPHGQVKVFARGHILAEEGLHENGELVDGFKYLNGAKYRIRPLA